MSKLIFAIAFGAAVVSAPVMAQGFGGGKDQTRAEAQQRADMMFQMMDANKDGTVTKAEAEQALAQFEAMRGGNSNGSGNGGGRMQRMMDQAFGTSQSLTQAQFEAQVLARFDAQDLNHDGTVTAAERQQAREQMRANAAPQTGPAAQVAPAPAAPAKPQ